jgi:hypothetical protein
LVSYWDFWASFGMFLDNEKKGVKFKTVRSIHKYCETTMTEIDVMPRLARYDIGEKNSSFQYNLIYYF